MVEVSNGFLEVVRVGGACGGVRPLPWGGGGFDAPTHETFEMCSISSDKVVFGSGIFARAVAGRASKRAVTRSRRVEIGRNMDHRMRV